MRERGGRPETGRSRRNEHRAALRAPGGVLALAGEILGFDRPAKTVARLQALPIGRDAGREILAQADTLREQQRVSNRDIGRRKAASAQHVAVSDRSLDSTKAAEKPFRIVGRDLRIAPLFRLKLRVA